MAQSVRFVTRGAPQAAPSSPQAAPHTNPSQCIPVHPSACWQPEQLLLRVCLYIYRGCSSSLAVAPLSGVYLIVGPSVLQIFSDHSHAFPALGLSIALIVFLLNGVRADCMCDMGEESFLVHPKGWEDKEVSQSSRTSSQSSRMLWEC